MTASTCSTLPPAIREEKNPSRPPLQQSQDGKFSRDVSKPRQVAAPSLDCSLLVSVKSTSGATSSQGLLGPAAPEKIGLIGWGHWQRAVTARASKPVSESGAALAAAAEAGTAANLERRQQGDPARYQPQGAGAATATAAAGGAGAKTAPPSSRNDGRSGVGGRGALRPRLPRSRRTGGRPGALSTGGLRVRVGGCQCWPAGDSPPPRRPPIFSRFTPMTISSPRPHTQKQGKVSGRARRQTCRPRCSALRVTPSHWHDVSVVPRALRLVATGVIMMMSLRSHGVRASSGSSSGPEESLAAGQPEGARATRRLDSASE